MDRIPEDLIALLREILLYLQGNRHVGTDGYLTKHLAAEYCRDKTTKPIAKLIREGRVPSYRIGKRTLVKKSELDAYIQDHEVTPQTRQVEKNDLEKLVESAIAQARKRTA